MSHIKTAFLWTPRVAALALAFFLAMFAMDVYAEGNDFWQTSQAFLTHLLPAFSVLVILAVGWRRDDLASIGFLLLAVAFFVAMSGWKDIANTLMLTLPPLGISLSFYARLRILKATNSAQDD